MGHQFYGFWQMHRITYPPPQPWSKKCLSPKTYPFVFPFCSQSFPPLIRSTQATTHLVSPLSFSFTNVHISGIIRMWPLSLASFTLHTAFGINTCCCMYQSFAFFFYVFEYYSIAWRYHSFLCILQLRDSFQFMEIMNKITINISVCFDVSIHFCISSINKQEGKCWIKC